MIHCFMAVSFIPIWKRAPFLRLLLPLVAGIIWHYYFLPDPTIDVVVLCVSVAGMAGFSFIPLKFKFKNQWVYGLLINTMLVAMGSLITATRNTSSFAKQVEDFYSDSTVVVVTLKEPLSEKPASWKSLAAVASMQNKQGSIFPATDILIYFLKDSTLQKPVYGARIAFSISPQRIKNFSAAGDFDYAKYSALKNIYFQVFLQPGDFIRLPGEYKNSLTSLLINIREWVIAVLKKYIPGKKEYGLAEALLIGYRSDLDKSLIQSYSNTGVVHVVAISGLHLGLIYALLKYFCLPLGKKRIGKWLTPLIIITGLWLFSLLAGGSPSVMRSAVMFTAIVLGECLSRRSHIINNLAASAFLLLCYNPYWLWDVGFQLSYTALLSIVIFMKPVYNLFIVKNKIIDTVWKLNAVTISAQIITAPVCLFYFHQFPNLFLFTNFIAVPLSSIILIGEIALCTVSFLPGVAVLLGYLLSMLIKLMNGSVEWFDSFPFSSWRGLYISFPQLVLLYVVIACAAGWLILRNKDWIYPGLVSAILFFLIR